MILDRLYIFAMFIPILAFHEFAHAWMAHQLGDDTAKDEGRLTLNPLPHIDPIGTLLIPAIYIFMSGGIGLIGWGKPVPVNLNNLSNIRRDEPLIALAGPVANLILAFISLAVGHFLVPANSEIQKLIQIFAFVAVFLAVFNLIPLPPLDGWNMVKHYFRMPYDIEERGGIWWFVALLIVINLPPVMMFLVSSSQSIVATMSRVLGA